MNLLIQKIKADGYERFVSVKTSDNRKLFVHYIEYSEYLEENEKTQIRKVGDILTTDISINLVVNSRITEGELCYVQRIQDSPHIDAVIEIQEVIDDYTVYAKTSLCEKNILVEFEYKIQYKKYDRVLIIGSLEIETPIVIVENKGESSK